MGDTETGSFGLCRATRRNPYERTASAWFSGRKPRSELPYKTLAERFELIARDKRAHPENHLSQKYFVQKSGAAQALYFERLHACLRLLPFVDKKAPGGLPPFPHNNKDGFRPPNATFLDLFTKQEEELTWNACREDFEFLGYERFNCGLPDAVPDGPRLNARA